MTRRDHSLGRQLSTKQYQFDLDAVLHVRPPYDIAPTRAPSREGARFFWRLIPSWAKDNKGTYVPTHVQIWWRLCRLRNTRPGQCGKSWPVPSRHRTMLQIAEFYSIP